VSVKSILPHTIPAGLVDKPQNLDLANWVLNRDLVDKDSGIDGPYTYGDVQITLWTLLCNSVPDAYINDWRLQPRSLARIAAIVANTHANGEGFISGPGQFLAVFLGIVDEAGNFTGQTTVFTLEIPNIPTAKGCWTGGGTHGTGVIYSRGCESNPRL
jgi:hypothetical protein